MPSLHKLIKHTFKIQQYLLQNFYHAFDHFIDTKRNEINIIWNKNIFQ